MREKKKQKNKHGVGQHLSQFILREKGRTQRTKKKNKKKERVLFPRESSPSSKKEREGPLFFL